MRDPDRPRAAVTLPEGGPGAILHADRALGVVQVSTAMLRDPRLGAVPKAVHAYLASYALEVGIWPPKRTMLRELATTEATLRHAVRELEAYGYLRVRTRSHVAGAVPSMLYTLTDGVP